MSYRNFAAWNQSGQSDQSGQSGRHDHWDQSGRPDHWNQTSQSGRHDHWAQSGRSDHQDDIGSRLHEFNGKGKGSDWNRGSHLSSHSWNQDDGVLSSHGFTGKGKGKTEDPSLSRPPYPYLCTDWDRWNHSGPPCHPDHQDPIAPSSPELTGKGKGKRQGDHSQVRHHQSSSQSSTALTRETNTYNGKKKARCFRGPFCPHNLFHIWKDGRPPCPFRHTNDDMVMVLGHHIRGFSLDDDQARADYVNMFIAEGKKKEAEWRKSDNGGSNLAIMDDHMRGLPDLELFIQFLGGALAAREAP